MGQSRQDMYNKELERCRAKKEALQGQLDQGGADIAQELSQVENEMGRIEGQLQQEIEKMQQWKIENMRRKHNYIPFLLKFLKILAEKGQLGGLVEKARAAPSS